VIKNLISLAVAAFFANWVVERVQSVPVPAPVAAIFHTILSQY